MTAKMFDARAKVFDVIAVDMVTHKVELIAEGTTEKNAEAIEMNAASSRGDSHFYTTVPHGKYIAGDDY